MYGPYERAIARKIADVFEIAGEHCLDESKFTKAWLNSNTAKLLYTLDFNAISQSPLYHYNSFIMEYKNIDDLYPEESYFNNDIMYWSGYLFSCWIFMEDVSPQQILQSYDIDKILLCYDTLHTVSIEVAVDMIKSDFVI